MREQGRETIAGVAYGVAAYVWWGLAAAYFKLVDEVGALEILAHRIIWSVLILLILVSVARRWPMIAHVFRSRRTLLWLAASTLLIAVNWFVYIWAITHDHMLDSSLGYFINPLVSVLLGFAFLHERLRRLEWFSIGLAAVAVLWLTATAGVFPWIPLVLATSFGLYGLVRKIAAVGSIEALTIETLLLLPVALGYLLFLQQQGGLAFLHGAASRDLLLIAAGPVTAVPLLCFAAAVQRLRLATVGLLQYISPSLQFVMAIALFGEPLAEGRIFAFVLIWIAVAIYSFDNRRTRPAEQV